MQAIRGSLAAMIVLCLPVLQACKGEEGKPFVRDPRPAGSPSDTDPGGPPNNGDEGANDSPSEDAGESTADVGSADAGMQEPPPKWPQCFELDKLVENPTLTLNPTWAPIARTVTEGYLAMSMGPKPDACITDDVIKTDLTELNSGFMDMVNLLGFPAFPDWKKGHYFNWYVLKSGLPGDTTAATAEGGGPGNRSGIPDFESTPLNICKEEATKPGAWNQYEAGGALHESIHAFQIVLDKYNNPGSGWFHEAHDVYLTTMRLKLKGLPVDVGWLVPSMLFAEHIPIESMGFYTDGTVSGPSDQGGEGRTMPQWYGGYRYGLELFPLSLALTFGRGFVNCLWTEPDAGNKGSVFRVLESMAGVEAVREAVLQFGARNSLLDYAEWTGPVTKQVKSAWNIPEVKPTGTGRFFYAFPTQEADGWLKPPVKQIPHHQGRNIIPLKVSEGATTVTVELLPDAQGSKKTPLEMRALFTYRETDGTPIYGQAFASGQATLTIPKGARNGLVNLVVAVVNPHNESAASGYGFDPNETFNYKVRIVSGATIAPETTVPW